MAFGIPGIIARPLQAPNFDPFKSFMEGQQFRNQQALQGGLPRGPDGSVDFSKAADLLAKTGQLGPALQVAQTQQQRQLGQQASQQLAGLLGGGQQPQGAPQGAPQGLPAPPTGGQNYGAAIAGIESGGRYDAVGPPTRDGDRAYGKYQVMGKNIGPWTKEVLGREMTPAQFLADTTSQDQVFQAKFGSYVQKYGPEGAARAWFAGEGGMNDPNRRDALGTTVQQYGQKFTRALGADTGGAPTAEGQPGYQPWPQMASQQPAQGGAAPAPAPGAPGPQAAPAPAMGGRQPGIPPLRELTEFVSSPSYRHLDKSQQDAVKELLKHQLEQSNISPWLKDYYRLKAEGDPEATKRSPSEWQAWMKKSGANSVNVNTAEGLDSAQTKERIKIDSDAAKEAGKQALAGSRLRPLLDTVERVAKITPGGMAGPISAQAARVMSGLGMEVPEGFSNAEMLQSISQRLVPIVREPGPTSEKELQMYLRAVPGLMQSQEGRLKVVRMTRAQIDRAQQIAKVYRDNIGAPDLYEKLAALDKPLIPESDRADIERLAQAPEQSPQGGQPQVTEGATATNPQTGQKIMFRGGQWVPAQ